MKIYKIAQQFSDLPVGAEVYSNLYKTEGRIKILDREEKNDIRGTPFVRYKAFFTNSAREGTIHENDISGFWKEKQ